MPWCDTKAMAKHLKEISLAVDPGCHAVLLLDQAGWHGSARLPIPTNITLLPLPPRSPELNPVENVWQTVCSLPKRRWLVPRYAANEGCAGWTGAEPHAEGTSHATG
jgi:transposase